MNIENGLITNKYTVFRKEGSINGFNDLLVNISPLKKPMVSTILPGKLQITNLTILK